MSVDWSTFWSGRADAAPLSGVRYYALCTRKCGIVPPRSGLGCGNLEIVGFNPIKPIMKYSKSVLASVAACALSVFPSLGSADDGANYDPSDFDDVTAIIGGVVSPLGNFPSSVALLKPSSTNTLFERQFCGGTAISANYILTAAHCMFSAVGELTASDVLVAGNFVDLNNESPAEIPVAQIFINPYYDDDDPFAENDIALLRTQIPHNIPPVQLFNGDSRKLTGELASIVGWGVTQTTPTAFASVLQEAQVPVTDFATCNNVYNSGLSNAHMCAGFQAGGVDACQGDSGGPLMIVEGEQIIQVGITSFGDGCALPDAYGVYSNVERYETWVSQIVPNSTNGRSLFTSPTRFVKTPPEEGKSNFGLGSADHILVLLLLGVAGLRSQARRVARLMGVSAAAVVLAGCVTDLPASTNEAVAVNTTSKKVSGDVKGVSSMKNELVVEASEEYKGLPTFDGVALTHRRDEALSIAEARYGVSPTCEGKKVAPRNSRRADFYERCDFTGLSTEFEGGTITSVTYHLLSARIVQIDATLAGAAVAMAPLANSLDAMLGESDFSADALKATDGKLPQAIYHWVKSPDMALARLQTSAAADDESFELSIQYPSVADTIAELPAL